MERFGNLDGAAGFELGIVGVLVLATPWALVIGAGAWIFVKLAGYRRERRGRRDS